MTKGILSTILIISLSVNISFFVFLTKSVQDTRGLNEFYSMRRAQLTENANQYNEESKLKVEEKVIAIKKGIADLGSVKTQMEQENFYTIVNYKEFYKNLYSYIDKKRMLNGDVSEWMREVGNSLYISIDKKGVIRSGIPSSLGKNFCDDKQMAFCYMFTDDSFTPKYEYRIADGSVDKITDKKVRYVMDNSSQFLTLRDLYGYFNEINLQDKNSLGKGMY